MSPLFTIELARQRQAELLASASRHRGPSASDRLTAAVRHLVAAVRADLDRMQLGRVETACQTC